MENSYITRNEHDEFMRRIESEHKRLEDEDNRQNHRIDALEESMKEISKLASNTEKLALNMESMLKQQEKNNQRLSALEDKDGEMWRKVVGYVLCAVVGILVGFVFKMIGM